MGLDLHNCGICKEAKTMYDGQCALGCSKCRGDYWICYNCLDDDSPLFQEQDEDNQLVCQVCIKYALEKEKRKNVKTELNNMIDIINNSRMSKKDKSTLIKFLKNNI